MYHPNHTLAFYMRLPCCLVFCSEVLFSLTSSFCFLRKQKKKSRNGKREKRRRSSEHPSSSSSSGQQIPATHWVGGFGCNGKKNASHHAHRQIQNNRTPHCECSSTPPPPPHSHLRHLRFPSSPLRPILSLHSLPGKCKTVLFYFTLLYFSSFSNLKSIILFSVALHGGAP